MIQYWMPADGHKATLAPSLVAAETKSASSSRSTNPTVIPDAVLETFHFTFLIRHPQHSVPSYVRCTVPPLAAVTGFEFFDPQEAGYRELRALFDYLKTSGLIGPVVAGQGGKSGKDGKDGGDADAGAGANGTNGVNGHAKSPNRVEICLIDADDLLDKPYEVIEAYCRSVGVPYSPEMLKWNDEEQKHALEVFEKWKGFHNDAIQSDELKPRIHKKPPKTEEQLMTEWTEKYGADTAQVIKKTVDENIEDYKYLKQFALQV